MRRILTGLVLLAGLVSQALAQFNNEWIDYSKTYYKFYIAAPGIYRITKPVLDAAGLGNTNAQHFQLWRNGKQVTIRTSNTNGLFGPNDFIEFFGDRNDGLIDKALFRRHADHIYDQRSLFTDTAAYFLTVNTDGNNSRYTTLPNDAASSSLTPLTHIWKRVTHDYKNVVNGIPRNYVNPGFAVNFGESVFSSAFEMGEMLSSGDIYPNAGGDNANKQAVFNNLLPYTAGNLSGKISLSIAGSADNNRSYRISLNGATLYESNLSRYQAKVDSTNNFALSQLANASTITITNLSSNVNDRIVAGFASIDYPRLPNAGNTTLFDFYLSPIASNSLLEIANFSHGNTAPVLYDLSSNVAITGVVMPNGSVRFLLPASENTRQFWLVANNSVQLVNNLVRRNFIPLAQSQHQANYVIITNKLLAVGNNHPIEQYRQYRSSAAGGAFNAGIYFIDELTDQFAYGVKMHPLAIKNFLRFGRSRWTQMPQHCFLIGKGVTYDEYRFFENHPNANNLQFVPTFGYPASDVLLASDDLTSTLTTSIGRLNVITATEVTRYLNKVKEHETNQANTSNLQQDKAWMKNVVHVVGANDEAIESVISPYMDRYRRIIEDTLFGGRVNTFNKFSSTTAATIENDLLDNLFEKGFSQLTYFGHSSATALDYNLDDPSRYNNRGKYPMFLLNGCNAGNFYTFDTTRLSTINTISEKYILAENRGAIGMIASTHFGIVSGLHEYSTGYYRSVAWQSYNQPIGRNMRDAIAFQNQRFGFNDFITRIHTEQQTLHGDPAVKINAFARPDYSIESPNININPSFLSIAETNFKTKVYYYNLGRAINDSMVIEVIRQYPKSSINPNGRSETVLKTKVKAPMAIDSLEISLPIFAERDKGANTITVKLDTENKIDESSETNNTATREIVIFEDELRPIYPYNFAIVNKQNIKLIASTSNPFSQPLNYRMELDTTELFNSGLKITRNISAKGGMLEFDPGLTFSDSTVYYWRLGLVGSNGEIQRWNNASFVYLAGTQTGFNQSHFYQQTKSGTDRLFIDTTSRTWQFNTKLNNLFINHSVFPVTGTEDNDFSISVNNSLSAASFCVGHSLVFNVFDPITFKPMRNYPGGAFGSAMNNCVPAPNFTRQNNFEWDDRDTANRRKIVQFMDAIPNGSYVVVRKVLDVPYDQETFAATLKNDEQFFGPGNTIYHRLKGAGFTTIDSFSRARIFIFVYKKNDPSFTPVTRMSDGIFDRLQLNNNCPTPDSAGTIVSPLFGPAKAWKEVKWRGMQTEMTPGDYPSVSIIGVNASGNETLIRKLNANQQDADIASINATQYPYLKLQMQNADSVNGTPYQLKWWRLYYTPVPEGALAPNMTLELKDTLEPGETLLFKIAFKNISHVAFDSLKLKAYVLDKNNVTHPLTLSKKKPLVAGDTTVVAFSVDTRSFAGLNTLYVAVNPDNDQPEQYFFNNFLFKTFFVREDKVNPLLDVTFDGQRILNRDLVSAKPHIQIKLKDENRFLALNDTAGLSIRLKFPGESQPRIYKWGSDTLQFTAATLSGGDNTATVDFYPVLDQDTETGGQYELTVSGKDRNGNKAGNIDYKISFAVINKPMISNLLNYPNPFSTSTAFVFTITGFEIPQEFKIQIMTVTGKIVKEISKHELGPLRIGTNITEYKWDGTDTYGQQLANGVYLYRVISSLNGNQLERLRLNDGYNQQNQDVTDQFFNKGYGKMVILR